MKTMSQIYRLLVSKGWHYVGGIYFGGTSRATLTKGGRTLELVSPDGQPRTYVRIKNQLTTG